MQQNPEKKLPQEIWTYIFDFLSFIERQSIFSTCSFWNQIATKSFKKSIIVEELKFYDTFPDGTFPINKSIYNLKPGMVVGFQCNIIQWNLFVVIEYDQSTNTITAVFPRLRLTSNKQVILGPDKLRKNQSMACLSCDTAVISESNRSDCLCGKSGKNRKAYDQEFFIGNYKYHMHRFSPPCNYVVWLNIVKKEDLVTLDNPLSHFEDLQLSSNK